MNNGLKPDTLSPEQLQRLGLEAPPFDAVAPDGRPFYDDAIDPQVNVALHILQHTDQVLLVHGEPGVGKTAFLDLLKRSAGEELLLIFLKPGVNDTPASVYRTIAEAGGIDGDEETSAVSALLRLWEMGQRPVVLLDDADHAPREVVEALLLLHATLVRRQTAPGLVLTTSRDLVPIILSAAGEEALEPHVVDLHAFDEAQTRDYIAARLKRAGSIDGGQLTDSQCRQIHHRTGGNPSNINREATRLLAAAVPLPGQSGPGRSGSRLMPVVIGTVVVLVSGLIGATFLVEEETETATQAPAPSGDTNRADELQELPDRRTLEEDRSGATQQRSTDDTTPQAAQPQPEAPTPAEDRPADETPQRTVDGQPPDQEAGQPGATTAAEEEPAPPQPAAQAESRQEPVDEEPPADEEPAPEQARTPAQATAEKSLAAPATERDKAPESASEKPQPELPAADRYTIQLVGAYNRDNLEGYVEDLALNGETRIVTTRRNDRDWHVVVYGNYVSREAAGNGLQRLPEKARAHGPWVRTFGSLR